MNKVLIAGFVSALIFLSKDCFSTAYYTRSTGNWTGVIWSTSSSGGTIIALPGALSDGDILYINHNVTITTNPDYITADLTVYIDATLIINGSLRVGAETLFIFPSSSGVLTSTEPGNSARLFIGPGNGNAGADWSSGRPTVTGPGSFSDGWSCPPCTLPITLMFFDAAVVDEIVTLSWITTMEENFSKFVVQRSADGLTFKDLAELPSKGFNIYAIESKYTFEDQEPLRGFNYYRLKAVDLDDSFEYFSVKAIKVNARKKLAIYPNPSSGDAVAFKTNFNPDESDRIVLIDQLGIEVFNGRASLLQNNITPESQLRPGIYILRYISDDFEQITRVVIKH